MKSFRHLILVLLGGVVFCASGYPQGTSGSGIGLNVLGGFLAAHHDYLQQLEAHSFGVEARFTLTRFPQSKGWASRMRLPRSGVGLLYLDMGNPSITGKALALIPYQEFRLMSGKTGSMYFRLGTGLAWLTRRYDPVENRSQIAIGGRLNPAMQVVFIWHKRIAPNLETDFGIGLTHFSNGNFKLPNYGVNIPNIQIGLTRVNGYHKRPVPLPERRGRQIRELDISFNGATKEEGIATFVRYGVWGLSLRYQKHRNSISRVFFGADYFVDNSYRFRSRDGRSFSAVSEGGLTMGHRLMMDKLVLFTEVGVYVLRPDRVKKAWYQRIGLNYLIRERNYVGVYLKTHLSQSDYVQFTIGHFLRKKT